MQKTKKFALDVRTTFIASAVSMFLGFVIIVVLGRFLGAGDLGLYQMVFQIYGIAMLFAAVGVPAAITKYVAEFKNDRDTTNAVVSSGIITSLFLGIVFSILLYLSAGIFESIFSMPGLSFLLKILSPVFPFALVGGILLGLLNGNREMKKYGIATVIQSVLMIIISMLLLYLGFGVAGVVTSIVLSSIGTCLYLMRVSRGYFEITLKRYALMTRRMLQFGAQISGTNAINMVNYQADIIMIGYFLTAADVGYYGIAAGISKFFWILPQAIQAITYPATSEYWVTKNHAALQVMIDKSIKYTACSLLPIGLGIGFFAEEIITTVFGEDFIHSVPSLLILIVGTVIFGLSKSVGGSVTGAGRPDLGLKVSGISAITNIVLNVLLIPRYGIAGAAIATMVSLSVNTLVGLALTVKILKVKIDLIWFGKAFAVTLLSVFLFRYLEFINIYLIGIVILSIYTSITYRFLLAKEDRAYFMQLLH